ncbi:MAG: hypothetical protein JJT78_12045, partial [Leptospira sp.]|nr:hypothetical protein [Leptospira sp.]
MNRYISIISILLVAFILHADSSRNFLPVEKDRKFIFPDDHKPHLGFKTEWWYYTGFLETEENQSIGIQFTLFKIELEPGNQDFKDSPILMVTHLGIANIQTKTFESYTDHVRLYPGLAQFNISRNGFEFRSKGKDL